jgi:hypothetical protein
VHHLEVGGNNRKLGALVLPKGSGFEPDLAWLAILCLLSSRWRFEMKLNPFFFSISPLYVAKMKSQEMKDEFDF